jgi:hypothetical protein
MPTTDDINHRDLPPAWLQQAQASSSGDVIVMLITISHPTLAQTIRFATEHEQGVSYANGKIINYRYGGNLFMGTSFSLALLKDDDGATETRLSIPNIDAGLSNWLQSLTEPLEFQMQVMLGSQFDRVFDWDNAITAIDGKEPLIDAADLVMVDIEGNLSTISARITRRDVSDDMFPRFFTLKRYTPALYWDA